MSRTKLDTLTSAFYVAENTIRRERAFVLPLKIPSPACPPKQKIKRNVFGEIFADLSLLTRARVVIASRKRYHKTAHCVRNIATTEFVVSPRSVSLTLSLSAFLSLFLSVGHSQVMENRCICPAPFESVYPRSQQLTIYTKLNNRNRVRSVFAKYP